MPVTSDAAAEAHHSLDYERRFGALARLYGTPGAKRIQAAHVAVVGIGGVGSWAAEALARSGVGALTLIDLDNIAESNINRQIHALSSTLGQSKVDAMRSRIFEINPTCQVHCVEDFVDAENWPGLLPAPVDALLDACDQIKAKVAMACWAKKHRIKNFVSVGAAGGKRLLQPVEMADLARTTHDPLLAQLRYQLRKHHGFSKEGKKMGLMTVFSKEAVMQPLQGQAQAESNLNCHGYGSVVTVTASFGFVAANFLLNQLAAQN